MDTPALSPASTPVTGEAASAPAEPGAGGVFEALIADFRWGDPEMGAVPHLPIPPPYKMRAEEAAEGGEEAPVGGNGGNPLPLHPLHLPLPAPIEFVKLPEVPPSPPAVMGAASESPKPARGATDPVPAPATALPVASAPSPATDSARLALEALLRQLPPASNAPVPAESAAPEAIVSRHREPAAPTQMDHTRTADRSPTPAVASSVASAVERAISTAMATPPSRDAVRPARAETRALHAAPSAVRTTELPNPTAESRAIATVSAPERGSPPEFRFDAAAREVSRAVIEIAPDTQPNQPTEPFAIPVSSAGPAATPTTAATTRPEAPVLHLDTPVTQPEWADGIGERIVWLSDNRINDAQIRLNPAHLGPVEVRVSVGEDQTSVSFIAHHAATREALESATPRLREMLSAHGFGTVNVNISHQSSGERSAQQPQVHTRIAHELPASDEYAREAITRHTRPSSNTLDAYA